VASTGPNADWNGKELPETERVNTLAQRELSDRAFKIYRSTLADADKYLDGRLLYLPSDLIEFARSQKDKRIEFKEGMLCLWSLAHSGFHHEDGWNYVHSDNFMAIWNKGGPVQEAKRRLIEAEFLRENPSYSEGRYSKSFKTQYHGEIVPYEIQHETKNIGKILVRQRDDDIALRNSPQCKNQREHLDKLTVDVESAKKLVAALISCWRLGLDARGGYTVIRQLIMGEPMTERQKEIQAKQQKKQKRQIKRLKEKITGDSDDKDANIEEEIRNLEESTPDSLTSDRELLTTFAIPLLKIIFKKGFVTRGEKSQRIFSPFTQLMREFRELISWDIDGQEEPWSIIDCVCCQPTLIAYKSEDAQMKKDCLSNSYYDRIAETLGQSRDKAKQSFCAYAFGRNRPDTSTNKSALAVQNLMKEFYPTAHQYIWDGKVEDANQFVVEMQQYESRIFIDDIFPKLMAKNIPCLSIHDGIFTTVQHSDEVKEFVEQTLREDHGIFQEVKIDHKNCPAK